MTNVCLMLVVCNKSFQRVMSYLYPCRLLSPYLLYCGVVSRNIMIRKTSGLRPEFFFLRLITFHYTESESRRERFEREFPRSTPNAVLSVLRILRFSDSYPIAVTYIAHSREIAYREYRLAIRSRPARYCAETPVLAI